jgi:hypothetical protein
MGRAKSVEKKVAKTALEVKNKGGGGGEAKTKEDDDKHVSVLEKLALHVDLKDIAENGFSETTWVFLSLEEKMNLPAFISSKFRQSDGTKADKVRNNESKRIIHNQIMKYEKYAKRKFYSANKKKIRSAQKKDSTLSGQGAVNEVWNHLDDAEKNTWYNENSSRAPKSSSKE